jgi:hypothetical protein
MPGCCRRPAEYRIRGRSPRLSQIDDDAARIGQALEEDELDLVGHRLAKILRIGGIDEMALPAEFGETEAELGDRAAIKIARGNEFVAALHQGDRDEELGGVTAGAGHRAAPAFERGDAFLEHRDRRIGHPRIDVAEGLQIEQGRRVIGIVEHERRGLEDRRRARAGNRVGPRAGVNRQGFDAVFVRCLFAARDVRDDFVDGGAAHDSISGVGGFCSR